MEIRFKSYQVGENSVGWLPGFRLDDGAIDPNSEDDLGLAEQEDSGGTPCVISAESQELMARAVSGWLWNVGQQAVYVSGDDDYYDYYPDNFYVADQIVEAIGLEWLKDHLVRVRELAVNLRYNEEPETIDAENVKIDTELVDAANVYREAYWNARLQR